MAQQFIQQLTVHLKGGQTVVVPFNAEKAEVLNPQIEAFIKALGDTTKKDGNFLFQGARVVLFRRRRSGEPRSQGKGRKASGR